MREAFLARSRRAVACCSVVLGTVVAGKTAPDDTAFNGQSSLVVSNVTQLGRLSSANPNASYSVRLEGGVWWANPAQGKLVLHDESGTEELEMDLQRQSVKPGQRVRVEGKGTITRRGAGFKIGVRGPVVDNNGVHGMTEKSGAVYLKAGRHPIRVEWFNGVDRCGLEVDYEGPSVPRQRVPDAALFRTQADAAGGTSNLVHGLDYRCYEVGGEVLPDLSQLTAVKTGTVTNFDLSVVSRPEHVVLEFNGFVEVPGDGLYVFHTRSDDGSRLFVGAAALRLEVTGQAAFPQPRQIAIGQSMREGEDSQWVEVEGKVTLARQQPDGWQLELSAGAGRMRVEVADGTGLSAALLLNNLIRATGVCQNTYPTDGHGVPGVLLVPSAKQILLTEAQGPAKDTRTDDGVLPVLTTAGEVHRLKREEAQRGYPVKIHGVVTCVLPEHQAVTMQDATRGIYVEDHSEIRSSPPQIGEYLEVEGTTDPSLFAPIVNARQVTSLGAGHLPDPVRPMWDQLMNGSLDAQYVEIQGIVTAVQTNAVTLLVRGGVIKAELRVIGTETGGLGRYEDALVRVRGCLLASWDYVTHQVKMGDVRIYGADIFVDQPAPTDLFSTPRKTAAELRLFDPQAGVFQRVKVSGQIVYARDPEYFMMDGGKGVRFVTKNPMTFEPGDEADVVGFPELFGSASPVLREAVARKTGHSAPPEANMLLPDELINAEHDASRVRVDGKLVNVRITRTEQMLEMQSGVRSFMAKLNGTPESVRPLTLSSKLELTGVYAAQGGNRAAGQNIASFELLLNSAADIKVLARPPFWTLERLLVAVGMLVCVLAITVLWITQLHRKVEERTAQLETQIRERQRVEQQRALEQERSRVAQDLHDDLGAGLTEISVLGKQARSPSAGEEKRSQYLEQMDDKARQMVGALDEIVWAMSPSQDSLASLVSYFCLYADRFLGLANIAWRLEGAKGLQDVPVNSLCRHELFMAFKEALTNVVRHSGATEVRLSLQLEQGQLRLSVADNGRGLTPTAPTAHMDGLTNMRARMEKLGGRFEIAGEAGRGTTLCFFVPTDN